jgi:ribA/ribD-fused uncharacterized protein
MSPYKRIFNDLHNSTLLTSSVPANALPTAAIINPHLKGDEDKGGGLFGLGRRKSKPGGESGSKFKGVFYTTAPASLGEALLNAARNHPEPLQLPRSSTQAQHFEAVPAMPGYVPSHAQPSHLPSSPVRFDHSSHLSCFMNHTSHPIQYHDNHVYPTALHLHEALKFLPDRPDLAERIRAVPAVQDVYPLSARFQRHVSPEWSRVYLARVCRLLFSLFLLLMTV